MTESTLTVHHLRNSRGIRVLWLLEELQVPYKVRIYELTPQMGAPPELFDVNPLGKSPCITDGDVMVAESGAIVQYIINKYGKGKIVVPEEGYVDDLYYSHFAEGSLMPPIIFRRVLNIVAEKMPFFIRPLASMFVSTLISLIIQPNLDRFINQVDQQLQKYPKGWFAGGDNPTMADFMMMYPLETIGARSNMVVAQSIQDYIKRVHARPAYQRVLDKIGPHAFASVYE